MTTTCRIAVTQGWGVRGGVLRGLIASTRWCDIAKEAVGVPILDCIHGIRLCGESAYGLTTVVPRHVKPS